MAAFLFVDGYPSRSSSSEIRIRVPTCLCFVCFSRVTLPPKKGKRALLGDLAFVEWLQGTPQGNQQLVGGRLLSTHPR